jgi:hypothetical protein
MFCCIGSYRVSLEVVSALIDTLLPFTLKRPLPVLLTNWNSTPSAELFPIDPLSL